MEIVQAIGFVWKCEKERSERRIRKLVRGLNKVVESAAAAASTTPSASDRWAGRPIDADIHDSRTLIKRLVLHYR